MIPIKGYATFHPLKHCLIGSGFKSEWITNLFKNKKILNGLPINPVDVFNGMGCLAASLITKLKDGPGNVYIDGPDVKRSWIDYEYYVWGDEYKDIWISIFEDGDCIFVGKPKALLDKYTN